MDLILDLVNYRPERGRLASLRVLEPSCGDGAFVSRVLARLVEGEREQTTGKWWTDPLLDRAITAADINPESLSRARHIVVSQLTAAGCPPRRAQELADLWIVEADFLLEPWQGQWDICVGNPPYVRIESLPRAVLEQYRCGAVRFAGKRRYSANCASHI